MKNDIFQHLQYWQSGFSGKKIIIKVEIISRAPNREISLVLCVCLRLYVGKTLLKAQTVNRKIMWYLKKKNKNHITTGRVKLSPPQNSQLLYPVQWLMKNWYISFIIDLIFLRLPDLTWFVQEYIRVGAYSAQHYSHSQSPNEMGFAWRQ